MAYKSTYELHHHFPKLAEESGFTFNTHRPRIHIDWNKIRLIDIDSLIRERKFILLEQYLNDILDCVLESEFDVRILDEGVMKMFRLAQLTVEYQQFCRHYLDRSVYVLREEINSLAKELETSKKYVREKDEEIKKLRKRTKNSFKNPLPYGNDNIATMILNTLTNKGDNIFPTTSTQADVLHYNRCGYCDKVFLNQLYLQSHISRRHPNVLEVNQRNQDNVTGHENAKLTAEIMELKIKLEEMENIISLVNKDRERTSTYEEKEYSPKIEHAPNIGKENENAAGLIVVKETNDARNVIIERKDAEVSTNNEEYLLSKIEEWKKEEHQKYNKEIQMLRNQIMETINSLKVTELEKATQIESKAIEQLQTTIKQQGAEILLLKKELNNSNAKIKDENAEKNKEAQAQSLLWSKRAEAQAKQNELLLQKLNQVAKDAQESRAQAEAERERASHFQAILQQNVVTETATKNNVQQSDRVLISHNKSNDMKTKNKHIKKKPDQIPHRSTFDQLQRKAQELLNIDSISSSSSDSSSMKKNNENTTLIETHDLRTNKDMSIKPKKVNSQNVELQSNHIEHKIKTSRKNKKKKERPKTVQRTKTDDSILKAIPGSPVKIVRAKLTEEVNNRLVAAGVDPLKNGIPRNVFQKQRVELQQRFELKSKKNPTHEKVRHSILAFLDSSTTDLKKEVTEVNDYISPSKIMKPFKSLTSVISNVKSKALSLVKMNEANVRDKRRPLNAEVAKRALSLLKTPPGSEPSSPQSQRHSPKKVINSASDIVRNVGAAKVKNIYATKLNGNKRTTNTNVQIETSDNENNDTSESGNNYYNSGSIVQQSSKSIENLIKSPARRPSSANIEHNNIIKKYTIDNGDRNLLRTQSETNIAAIKPDLNNWSKNIQLINHENSSDDDESLTDNPIKKGISDDYTENKVKQTKGVLKNATSTSSLNKKKVLFDMDAIQMKSVSASPSQSTKSEANEQYELGLVNLDGEEWDISSIDNEPLKNHSKLLNARTSPKIAELTQTIEDQLARRKLSTTSGLIGGVDLMAAAGSVQRAASVGGSNTSLGSSILDDSDTILPVTQKAFVKSQNTTEKDDSELDISEFSIDGLANKNESF